MFNLSSHTVRGNLIPALMIQSIFLWLRANPFLLCQAWNIHTPAVAWQGSRKSSSLLSLPLQQSDLLSLLLTQLELQCLNSQSTIHMEEFYLRVQRYAGYFYHILSFSLASFVSFFSHCCWLNSFSQHSSHLS